jgi:hypothetical protein
MRKRCGSAVGGWYKTAGWRGRSVNYQPQATMSRPFGYTAPENVQAQWLRRKTLPAAGLAGLAEAAANETVGEFGSLHSRSSSSGSSNWSKESSSSTRRLFPQRTGSISSRINLPKTLASATPVNATMQAIKLQKKYPQVSQQEMFALIEKFKSVSRR